MNIVEEIEAKYRAAKGYGVTFSIDPECYDVNIDESRISYGESVQDMCGGVLTNYQDIYIDGKYIEGAFLKEQCNGRLFDPMTTSYCLYLADCSDENFDEFCEANKDNPHFCDWGESAGLSFATLQQLLDYKQIK